VVVAPLAGEPQEPLVEVAAVDQALEGAPHEPRQRAAGRVQRVPEAGTNDCNFSTGPADSAGNVPMRADCHWSEADVAKIDRLLSNWAAHKDYFWSVVDAQVIKVEGGRTLMHQEHQASGISNREATLWGGKEPIAGGYRYTWTMDGAQQTAVKSGNVQCGKDTGFWEITAHPDGGARVVYHLLYDPAGSVPGWLVRSFQTGGIVTLVGELRTVAAK
jgi:hypothetical protein